MEILSLSTICEFCFVQKLAVIRRVYSTMFVEKIVVQNFFKIKNTVARNFLAESRVLVLTDADFCFFHQFILTCLDSKV